jgi:hypothetical protein
MANPSSDQIVEQARQVRRKQVEDCARKAAKKIVKMSKLSEAAVIELLVREFEPLTQ